MPSRGPLGAPRPFGVGPFTKPQRSFDIEITLSPEMVDEINEVIDDIDDDLDNRVSQDDIRDAVLNELENDLGEGPLDDSGTTKSDLYRDALRRLIRNNQVPSDIIDNLPPGLV